MSSDENAEALRAPSRGPRSSNASPRGYLPPVAPILPSLRSLSTRRPSATSTSNNSSTSTLPRMPSRLGYYDIPDPWIAVTGGTSVDFDELEQHGTEEQPAESDFQSGFEATAEGERSMLRAFLTRPMSTAMPELYAPPSPQRHELPEENRRVKRRKLDSNRLSPNFQGFQYGKYGQVEPGPLKMELVSCDGGIYSDDTTKYSAENILKNDNSVYCTEGPRCNIVLRHQGNTVFTLKELVIKAPRSNFTSPVQAGMVFVSMTSDHLLNRTAQYQIQYSPARNSSRRGERDTPANPIISIRHNEDGSTMTRAQVRARRLYNIGLDDEDDDDGGVAQIPSEFNVSPPPFQVTTECSDDDEDGIDMRLNGRAPNRIGPLPFESSSDDDDSDDEGPDDFSISGTDYRSRRRRNRSSTTLAEAEEAVQIATQEAVRAVGGELMTPNARFYIEPDKSRCTIRFDPPLSGRFILLKMWNPRRGSHANIDIRAVIARGFAGPRFFPRVDLQ
ncbi:hypothetical protein GGS24DRAFT_465032 [Hypoxylon argillaceum]|nr:hypothetical protein GGS24DRAFT_465032 [Hypoxylon argillaceum]